MLTDFHSRGKVPSSTIINVQSVANGISQPVKIGVIIWRNCRYPSQNKYVSGDWSISTHADLRPHATPYSTNGASLAWRLWCAFPYENLLRGGWPIRRILGFWGAKFPKMGDSLPRMPLSHRAKFDATSLILAWEIRNHTNKKKQSNSKRYIHTLPTGMCG